jgi:D-alanyl-D-alanine carboxypeptidase (penicillin-binding protein 5/6)
MVLAAGLGCFVAMVALQRTAPLGRLSLVPIASRGAAVPSRAASAASPRPALGPATPSRVFATDWIGRNPQPALDVRASSAVLVDLDTREVMWQRQPHLQRPPASLAKLVTAMVAADLAPLDRPVTVAPQADAGRQLAIEPSSTLMGLGDGEVLTVRELLQGVFLRSANDAAEVLAGGIVPRDRFVSLMNERASAIGMSDSHFTGPVGLDDPAMHSTAYDLAIAAATIDWRYPELAAIASAPDLDIPQTSTHKAFAGRSWLHSFLTDYSGASGMKTGFTDGAGGCVVATATRGGRHLLVVAMDSPVFVTDAEKLLDYGFSRPAQRMV